MSISPETEGRASARVQIGKIVGAHGVKGTLRVHPLTDYPKRFAGMKRFHVEKPGKPPKELDVKNVSFHDGKGQILVEVEGVDDRDAAELLSGWLITVSGDERVELPDGEYWIDSLIGLDVRDAESGELLGVISDVMPTGSHDVYQVRTPDGALKMIPAIANVVREIDTNAGTVRVSLLEGLWD
jgi:16S rRNA processing protein RimM